MRTVSQLLLSTARIVLINGNQNADVKAFDIPLAYMYNEKFKQPLFGDNYFAGRHAPSPLARLRETFV